jgi:hypothetical protein
VRVPPPLDQSPEEHAASRPSAAPVCLSRLARDVGCSSSDSASPEESERYGTGCLLPEFKEQGLVSSSLLVPSFLVLQLQPLAG